MRPRNDLILADLIALRAGEAPDFDVVSFDGGGRRTHLVRTFADLWMNTGGRRSAAGARSQYGRKETGRAERVLRQNDEAPGC